MLTDVYYSFTVRLGSKFATRAMSYFPPHLQRVITLPCEQEAQLSQRDCATLRDIEYFAKSLKVIRNDTVA